LTHAFEPLTPTAFLRRGALVHRDRTALVDGERRLSYAELERRALGMAGSLAARRHGPGERVAVLATNSAPLLEAHYAVPFAGAVMVPLNHRLAVAELAYIVEHAGATLLICDEQLAERGAEVAAALNDGLEVVVEGDGYEELVAAGAGFEPEPPEETGLLSLNYTSGTTGRPKGVMYHHRGAYLQALAMAWHTRLDPSARFLWTLPMFHCHGWCFTWAVSAAGGTHVCLRETDPAAIWAAIERERITHLNAAPTLLLSIAAAAPEPTPGDVAHSATSEGGVERDRPRIRVATGGAPPTPTLLAELAELGIEVTHLYGLTETFGPVAICEWKPEWDELSGERQAALKARQGVGNVIAQPLRVLDQSDADVPADGETLGEVAVRGNDVMLGYYRDEEATAEALRGGFFHTGDLGVMHPDGYVELRDRAKDVIVSGGENVSSVEVEAALASHPAVFEAAVVPAPHPRWGERPVAYVVLRPGQEAEPQELDAHVRARLAGFKAPAAYEFRAELPKTATGKVRKFVLRDEARAIELA
jgi:fatty-acyl-CoA synthase